MDLSTLQSQFQVLVPAFPYSSYSSRVTEWFNQGQREVCKQKIVDDVVAVSGGSVAGQMIYSKPSGVIAIKKDGLYFNDKPMTMSSLELIREQFGDDWKSADNAEVPEFYLEDSDDIYIIAPPDSDGKTIKLHAWVYADDLSASSDVPFTTSFTGSDKTHSQLRYLDDVVLDYAIKMANFAIGKYATKKDALTEFYQGMQEALKLEGNPENKQANGFGIDPYLSKKMRNRVGL